MKLSEYQDLSYYAVQCHDSLKDAVSHWAVGLTEEAGEVSGCVKHKFFNYEDIPLVRFAEELGDTLWYIAAMCSELGLDMDVVAELNVAKNRCKYLDGKFDPERSAQRHENYAKFQDTQEYANIVSRMMIGKDCHCTV